MNNNKKNKNNYNYVGYDYTSSLSINKAKQIIEDINKIINDNDLRNTYTGGNITDIDAEIKNLEKSINTKITITNIDVLRTEIKVGIEKLLEIKETLITFIDKKKIIDFDSAKIRAKEIIHTYTIDLKSLIKKTEELYNNANDLLKAAQDIIKVNKDDLENSYTFLYYANEGYLNDFNDASITKVKTDIENSKSITEINKFKASIDDKYQIVRTNALTSQNFAKNIITEILEKLKINVEKEFESYIKTANELESNSKTHYDLLLTEYNSFNIDINKNFFAEYNIAIKSGKYNNPAHLKNVVLTNHLQMFNLNYDGNIQKYLIENKNKIFKIYDDVIKISSKYNTLLSKEKNIAEIENKVLKDIIDLIINHITNKKNIINTYYEKTDCYYTYMDNIYDEQYRIPQTRNYRETASYCEKYK